MSMFNQPVIKRTVPIPFIVADKKILSLIEIGGELFSKDYTYRMFFEYGFEGVKNRIKEEIENRGGDASLLEEKINEIHEQLLLDFGVSGQEPIKKSKKNGKAIRVKK